MRCLGWARSGRQICLAGAGAVAAVTLLGSTAAFGAQPGGFSVRPAHVDPADPATRAYFKPIVAAGFSFHDQVVIGNRGDAPVDLLVSGVDGLTAPTSGAVYANRQDPVAKAGAWLSPAISQIRVAPHSERNVDFTVRVPADASPGDHLAGVAVEDAHPRTSGGGFAVTEVIRAVVGVQVQVPGPALFHAHVDGVDLAPLAGAGTGAVVIHIGDDGDRLGKPHLCVSLSGPHGYGRAVDTQLDTLLPGDTIPFPLPWPDTLKPGDYGVSVASCGVTPVLYRARLHLGTTLTGPRHATRTKPSPGQFPWWILVVTGLGGVLLGAAIMRRPRRSRAPDAAPSGAISERPTAAAAPTTRGPAA